MFSLNQEQRMKALSIFEKYGVDVCSISYKDLDLLLEELTLEGIDEMWKDVPSFAMNPSEIVNAY